MGREMETCNRRVPTSWTWGQWHWVSWAQFSPLGLEPCHHPGPVPLEALNPLELEEELSPSIPQPLAAYTNLYIMLWYVIYRPYPSPILKTQFLCSWADSRMQFSLGFECCTLPKSLRNVILESAPPCRGCVPLSLSISAHRTPPGSSSPALVSVFTAGACQANC